MTPEEELALRRASAILRAVGIATVEFRPEEEEGPAVGRVSVWNVARMGVYGETLVDAVRAFVASGYGEPL